MSVLEIKCLFFRLLTWSDPKLQQLCRGEKDDIGPENGYFGMFIVNSQIVGVVRSQAHAALDFVRFVESGFKFVKAGQNLVYMLKYEVVCFSRSRQLSY